MAEQFVASSLLWCKAKPKDMVTQLFREYGKCIFVGKCSKPKQVGDNQAESSRGKHVTRARSWWKRGETNMREAWEHEGSKDEMNIVLQGLEQHFWKGTKAGWMGCYDFPGETWAGDGSANQALWGQEVSAFNDPVATLQFEWVERRESVH